jgi:diaminohydroxyphosphoribosylaminopyrimidine deaminase / 5-amino-6-(5-phosphoribosylamino)uracil reductase
MPDPGPCPVDRSWMSQALTLAGRCSPSWDAYSVGAIIVDSSGVEISHGFSRETDQMIHAEEAALGKVPQGDRRLGAATVYTTLEPCSERASRPRTCTELILASGIRRVVIAWREPGLFVVGCQGVEILRRSGVEVVELREFEAQARELNCHLTLG